MRLKKVLLKRENLYKKVLSLNMTEQQEHLGCFQCRSDRLSACQLKSFSAFDAAELDTTQQHRELIAPDLDGIELVVG